MKFVRNLGLGLALASFGVAGVAQAETRSASAMPSYTPTSAHSVARGSAPAANEDALGGPAVILAILAIAAIIAAIAIAAGGSDSPG